MVTVKKEKLSRKKKVATTKTEQKLMRNISKKLSMKEEILPVKTEQKLITKIAKDRKTAKTNVSWDERYNECKEFKKKNGHCKIPTAYKENKSLGIWVQEVRRNFKLMMKGKKPRQVLNQARIDELNEIEFYWGFTPDPNKFPEDDFSWEKNFEDLKNFKDANDIFDVPMDGDFKKLGTWTRVQRTQKKRHVGKLKCFITKDRIKKLDEIRFDWDGERKINE